VKWSPTQKVECAACGGRAIVPTPEFLSLQAVCPNCGASLASAREERLRWYAGCCREIELFMVGYELQTAAGIDLSESEFEDVKSLEDLGRIVTNRLPSAENRNARAVELVTEIAQRVAPDLFHDADFVQRVIQRESAWWSRRSIQAEPRAAPGPAA
jgi:hypothetical protein